MFLWPLQNLLSPLLLCKWAFLFFLWYPQYLQLVNNDSNDQGRAVDPRTPEHSGVEFPTQELFWGWILFLDWELSLGAVSPYVIRGQLRMLLVCDAQAYIYSTNSRENTVTLYRRIWSWDLVIWVTNTGYSHLSRYIPPDGTSRLIWYLPSVVGSAIFWGVCKINKEHIL